MPADDRRDWQQSCEHKTLQRPRKPRREALEPTTVKLGGPRVRCMARPERAVLPGTYNRLTRMMTRASEAGGWGHPAPPKPQTCKRWAVK